MSLSVDGFWKAGFWSTTFWADGFWFEGAYVPPVDDETQNPGGWPSYGYRRKKRRPVEEIEEKIESQEIEIEDLQSRIAKERAQQEKIEAKARRDKADQTAILKLKAGIAADLQVIEEMRRIHDELLTLKWLEQYAETKRRKRNQLTAILMA